MSRADVAPYPGQKSGKPILPTKTECKKQCLKVVLEARGPFKTIPHICLDILNLAKQNFYIILMRF